MLLRISIVQRYDVNADVYEHPLKNSAVLKRRRYFRWEFAHTENLESLLGEVLQRS